jgi:hypothetical protein
VGEAALEYARPIEEAYAEPKEKHLWLKARRRSTFETQECRNRAWYRKAWLDPIKARRNAREIGGRKELVQLIRKRRPAKSEAQNFPHGLISAVQRMIELLELPPGWNSYNAKPIRKENVNFALSILGRTMRADTPPPTVIPMVRGGVQLEWHIGGINLEISIYSPSEGSFFAENVSSGGDPVEAELNLALLKPWMDLLSQ